MHLGWLVGLDRGEHIADRRYLLRHDRVDPGLQPVLRHAVGPDHAHQVGLAQAAEAEVGGLGGGLAELVIRWLDGSLAVSRERLVDHCAKLFVASAQITSRR